MTRLGPTQQLVLCALDELRTATTDEVAAYMSRYQQEAGWTGSTPTNERPAAYRALDRLRNRGLVRRSLRVRFGWLLTDTGRAALREATDAH